MQETLAEDISLPFSEAKVILWFFFYEPVEIFNRLEGSRLDTSDHTRERRLKSSRPRKPRPQCNLQFCVLTSSGKSPLLKQVILWKLSSPSSKITSMKFFC